jgi:hypothetical protein
VSSAISAKPRQTPEANRRESDVMREPALERSLAQSHVAREHGDARQLERTARPEPGERALDGGVRAFGNGKTGATNCNQTCGARREIVQLRKRFDEVLAGVRGVAERHTRIEQLRCIDPGEKADSARTESHADEVDAAGKLKDVRASHRAADARCMAAQAFGSEVKQQITTPVGQDAVHGTRVQRALAADLPEAGDPAAEVAGWRQLRIGQLTCRRTRAHGEMRTRFRASECAW